MNDELIYDWIALVTGQTNIIKSRQNGPRPTPLFLTWYRVASVPIEYTSYEGSPDGWDVDVTYQSRHKDTITVECWGENARTTLQKLAVANEMPAPRKLLKDSGATFIEAGSIRDMTQIIDTKYSPVYQVDLEFLAYYYVEQTEEDMLINSVELTGTLEDDAETEYTVTAEAP